MAQSDTPTKKGDMITIFIAILGIAVAFVNIYKFAQHKQPGSAIWSGVALLAFSFLLATQLAKMRKA